MQALVLGTVGAVVAWKISDSHEKHKIYRGAKAVGQDAKRPLNEYVRDDYEATRRLFSDYTDEQLLKMGIPMGDYDYYVLKGRRAWSHAYFDPYAWPNQPNVSTLATGRNDF